MWIFYSKRDDKVGLPHMVYPHFGFLLWLAIATTAQCFVLARRSVRVKALQETRRNLVSEAMQSDERHNRDRIVLTIGDDGFEPEIVSQYVADGHIGLGSLLARFDAMGGWMDIDSHRGYGTQITATSPPEPVAELVNSVK